MKQKKIFALTLVLALLIGMFSIIPTAGATSNDPVKLIYAKTEYDSNGGIGAFGYVEVQNIAYAKKVTIHYTYNGTDWYDCAAEYYKPTWGNYEAWKFQTPGTTSHYRGNVTVKFAIKYEVNGQTYWDNNNQQGYTVTSRYASPNRYDFGSGGIASYNAYRYYGGIDGTMQLKNLGPDKDVKVLYSDDNWATTKSVSAVYQSTFEENPNIEIWSFNIFPSPSSTIQYKLSYTVNGTTYVDDNFGEYYTV